MLLLLLLVLLLLLMMLLLLLVVLLLLCCGVGPSSWYSKLKQFLIEFCMGNARAKRLKTERFSGPNEAISMHMKWLRGIQYIYV